MEDYHKRMERLDNAQRVMEASLRKRQKKPFVKKRVIRQVSLDWFSSRKRKAAVVKA